MPKRDSKLPVPGSKISRRISPEAAERRRRQARDYTHRRIAAAKAVIDEYRSRPCADCGHSYPPEIMHLDHRDPTQKLFTVSRKKASRSLDAIRAECEKCDTRCPTCHALKHHNEEYAGIALYREG